MARIQSVCHFACHIGRRNNAVSLGPLAITVHGVFPSHSDRIGTLRTAPLPAIIATGDAVCRSGSVLDAEIAESIQTNTKNALGDALETLHAAGTVLIIGRIAQACARRAGLLQRGGTVRKEEADAVRRIAPWACAGFVVHVIVERHMQTVLANDGLVIQHRTALAFAVIRQLQVTFAVMPLNIGTVLGVRAAIRS